MVDLDGVLSDASGRQALLSGAQPDWGAFFSAAGSDPVLPAGAALMRCIDESLAIVISTGRPARLGDLTVEWLARHGLRWDVMAMRPRGNVGHAVGAKRNALRELTKMGFEVIMAVDDDPGVVEMYREEGLACLAVDSGYYSLHARLS